MELHFVPECYFDTVLLKNILGVRKVNHRQGCDNVINELEKGKRLKDDFAVALIDNDKRKLKYIIEECITINKTQNLLLLKHKDKKHYIVQLVPAIERWVLKIIEEGQVDMEGLNLQADLNGLKEFTKYESANESEELHRLCKRLINSNSHTMKTLIMWLTYLYKHNRNADINILKENV
ncbi:MAG: hypothetical protein IAE95_08965 [Chitinophagaceae bacterium]|nr:hypothetical protein [Chitinophagaceae bacterium]